MKKILLVKTSSLGDVVHNLPVVGDIRRHIPEARIDWVVEEAYAPLVRLNPGVRRAIPVAVRRWRSQLFAPGTWAEMRELRRTLKTEAYDAVIDTQGLLKSALIAAAASGIRHGYDAASAREPVAARFYDCVHAVPRERHAVVRNRALVAESLGYRPEDPLDFGLSRDGSANASQKSVVFLHATSRADKLWPEASWMSLGRCLEQRGFRIVLPWGSDAERERARRIGQALVAAAIPEAMAIAQLARLLAASAAVIGVDTGLAHLAAAIGVPVVGLYCATEPGLTGIYGGTRCLNIGGIGSPPSPEEALRALETCGVL